MKNSKILKGICYCLIPILILILVTSIVFELFKTKFYNETFTNSNYFLTDNFLSHYMDILSNFSYSLIYDNSQYNSIDDTESNYKICYTSYQDNISDFYFLILYKNLAITNVELTTNTNTIEKIKSYIENSDAKKSNIINGEVFADSEVLETKALQYFDNFNFQYYTKNVSQDPNTEENMIWYNTSINDFSIYTTYTEQLKEYNNLFLVQNIVEKFNNYENIFIVAIPICSIALVIMIFYLIISIGHTKENNSIDLNDFDKLPIEIIIIISIIIISVFIGIFSNISSEANEYFNLIASIFIAMYFVTYIVCMINFVTILKRIKAKVLIKNSLCGKCFSIIVRILRKLINKIKIVINNITLNWKVSTKIILASGLIGIILIFLIAAFNVVGVILDLYIIGFIIYEIIKNINYYKKIENHLKLMYEGNQVEKLNENDFNKYYKNIIIYINDISKGFENAKQEGIKSERMKTELITNVSHDIKTPLTSIINYVDLLKKENISDNKIKEYIEVLDTKSQRLKKLTEDLVEASKASSGAVNLNIEKINIVELIKQTTGEFEDKFKQKKLEIILNIPKEYIYINADSRYIYRIIENLFSNISKYALDSSRVYIDIIHEGQKVKIIIKNISKEKLNISAEELMQRFVRGDKSRTTEGSGLGLSISQSLTELQNGTFSLHVDGDLFKVELEFNIV